MQHDAVLAPGATFEGRYEIVAKLGEGGFGAVHKARQLSAGQMVALKILRSVDRGDAARTDARIARFLREARAGAQLLHPNIVQLVDSGQMADGTLYIAFAFVPGQNLAALLFRQIRGHVRGFLVRQLLQNVRQLPGLHAGQKLARPLHFQFGDHRRRARGR